MSHAPKTLFDTNVLIYAIDIDSEKHAIAKELVRSHLQNGTFVVSAQNLAEFTFIVTEKKKQLTFEQANQFLMDLADNAPVLTYGSKEVIRANQLKQTQGVPFFDALIAATIEKNSIFTIMTENARDFKKINWLEVVNPFQ